MQFWIFWFISSTIFFGVIGFIAALVSLLIYMIFKQNFIKIKNIKDKGLSKQTQRENFMLDLSEIIEKEKDVKFDINKYKSYKQILYYGTNREKIELIGMVVYNPSAEYVNLIRIALNDNDETVRILSSTSLQKMESYYEDKIKEYKNLLNNSKNEKEENINFRKLIYTYSDFIESTLIDSSLKKLYINTMFEEFESFLKLKEIKSILYTFISMSIKYNKLEGIEEILLKQIEESNKIGDKFLLIELYYKESKFSKLFEVLKTINKEELINKKQIESYEYWSNI